MPEPATNPSIPRPGTHVPALDGVRGLAILMVMVGHFITYGGLLPEGESLSRYTRFMMIGGLGVDLFFVLSGFLITGILLDSKGAPGFFRNFYMRRVLRIFPLYYGALVVAFVLAPPLLAGDAALAELVGEQAWYWSYTVNIRIAFWGWTPWHIGHFWSLAVEEQFYMLWPLLVFVCGRRTFLWVCLTAIGTSLLVRTGFWLAGFPPYVNVFTPATMDGLAWGALLAVLAREPGGMDRLRRWARPLGAVTFLMLAAFLTWTGGWDPGNPLTRTVGRSTVAIFFASLLVLAAGSPPRSLFARIFCSRTLIFFGVYSYGMYVIHQPLILLLRQHGLSLDLLPVFPGSRNLGRVVVFSLGMGLTILLSLVSYHLYERPFLKLKRYFPSGSTAPRRGQAARPGVTATAPGSAQGS